MSYLLIYDRIGRGLIYQFLCVFFVLHWRSLRFSLSFAFS